MQEKKRLDVIVSFIDEGAAIADVGSDHCYVPINAFNGRKVKYAQAIENKKGPYERMLKEIQKANLKDRIVPSLSSGLDELSKEVDTLIIAGMGGKLIKEIFQKNENKLDRIETIIVDAHNDRPILISYLESINYHLIDNDFFYEGKIAYDVMKWAKGKTDKPYSEEEVFFGPLNLKKKSGSWIEYWEKERNRIQNLLNLPGLPKEDKTRYQGVLEKINSVI